MLKMMFPVGSGSMDSCGLVASDPTAEVASESHVA